MPKSRQGTPAHAHGAGTELVVLGLVGGQGVALGRGWVSEAGCAPPGHGVLVQRAEGREGGGYGYSSRSARGNYHPTTTHLPLSKVTLFCPTVRF